jgi:uncharacterized OsmC-like protein
LEKQKQGLLKRTQDMLTSGLATNPVMVKVESANQNGFHTKISIRNHVLESDQPFGFEGSNKGPKPSELVLAALAACQETTWRIYAEDIGIKINQISVTLTGTQDLRGFMSLDKHVPSGFTEITGEVQLDSTATLAELKELQILVDKHCPILDDLTRKVKVHLNIRKT